MSPSAKSMSRLEEIIGDTQAAYDYSTDSQFNNSNASIPEEIYYASQNPEQFSQENIENKKTQSDSDKENKPI